LVHGSPAFGAIGVLTSHPANKVSIIEIESQERAAITAGSVLQASVLGYREKLIADIGAARRWLRLCSKADGIKNIQHKSL
jgi:hypothetical protein